MNPRVVLSVALGATATVAGAQSFNVLTSGAGESVWLSNSGLSGVRPGGFWDEPDATTGLPADWSGVRSSPDGVWALGSNLGTQRAGRVQRSGVVQQLPDAPSGTVTTTAYSSSLDNGTVVGSGRNDSMDVRAFIWRAQGGTEDLGTLAGDFGANAQDVSADGNVVVGFSIGLRPGSGDLPFRWSAADGMTALAAHDGGVVADGRAGAVSADGMVIVGVRRLGFVLRGYRWTGAGLDVDLPAPFDPADATIATAAYATTADGAWTAGRSNEAPSTPGGSVAVVWDAAGRPWRLADLLTGAGVTAHAGYDLTSAVSISSDASTISGSCIERATQIAGTFIARVSLTRTCPPDLGAQGGGPGGDGVLDNNDFIAFIDAFFARSSLADMGSTGGAAGPDGQFDNNDFISFISQFFDGCAT